MKVKYLDHMGDDLEVVNDARVSFANESDWEYPDYILTSNPPKVPPPTLSERDRKLIKFLADHDHWTPFANGGTIKMHFKVPIFVVRQLQKHQAGFEPFNEISRRYVKTPPEFYFPDAFRKGADDIKQGSTDEILDLKWLEEECLGLLDHADDIYETLLAQGVCREQARMFLPQNMYTEFRWKGNLYAWVNLYKKRSAPDAQKEVRMVAEQIKDIVEPLFPISWKALTNGKD